MKKIILLVSLLLTQFSFAELPKTLQFGTEATYPPFESMDSKGRIEGFDVDVVQALCQEMKVICVVNNQPWDSLIPSLEIGKFNALIGAMNMTDERKKAVDFSDAYYKTTASFVTSTDPNAVKEISAEALKGKRVGVQRGTSLQTFLESTYPQTQVKTYNSQQDAFLDLVSDRVDVVLADTPTATSWLKNSKMTRPYVVVGAPVTSEKYFGEGYGIAVKKGNTELVTELNKALKAIQENGTYQKILQQYF